MEIWRKTARAAVLAMAVEPFYNRERVTWRGKDVSERKKMPDFVAAAVATYPWIENATRAMIDGEPAYRHAEMAVKESAGFHTGSRSLNLGLIEAIVPVIGGVVLYENPFDGARKFLQRNTGEADVFHLNRMLEEAWASSRKPAQRAVAKIKIRAENAWEYYVALKKVLKEHELHGDVVYVSEILGNWEMAKEFYGALEEGEEAVYETHGKIMEKYRLHNSPGVPADFLAVALFVKITEGWVPSFAPYG